MTDDAREGFPALSCSTIVLRAATRQKQIDEENRRLTPVAYELRDSTGEREVSVGLADVCSAAEFHKPENCHQRDVKGVGSNHVGWVRAAGLDVVQDARDHAGIVGLHDLDPIRRYQAQEDLSFRSRLVWHHRWPDGGDG